MSIGHHFLLFGTYARMHGITILSIEQCIIAPNNNANNKKNIESVPVSDLKYFDRSQTIYNFSLHFCICSIVHILATLLLLFILLAGSWLQLNLNDCRNQLAAIHSQLFHYIFLLSVNNGHSRSTHKQFELYVVLLIKSFDL